MTLSDLKYLLCAEFYIQPEQIKVYVPEVFFDGTIWLTIDADILSQDVNRFLRYRAPIMYRFITVTAGWVK